MGRIPECQAVSPTQIRFPIQEFAFALQEEGSVQHEALRDSVEKGTTGNRALNKYA
jgi:hypothetical protein